MDNEVRLSGRERQIMDILHRRGEATAAVVLEGLLDPPGYSAVRAMLRILEEKGHITHRDEDGRYVYRPRISPEAASRGALRRVVNTFFKGSVAETMAALLESADAELPELEVRRLRKIIDQARKDGR